MPTRWQITLYGCGCDNSLKPRKWAIEAENEAEAKAIATATKNNLIGKGFRYRKVRVKALP